MKNRKIFLVCVSSLFLFFLFSRSSAAQRPSYVAQYLIDQGKAHYKNGETEKAIHSWSQVLLIEPGNKTASDCLKKLGIDGNAYGREENPAIRAAVLSQEMSIYKDKITDLEIRNQEKDDGLVQLKEELNTQKAALAQYVQDRESDINRLQIKMNLMQEDYAQRAVSDQERMEELSGDSQDFQRQVHLIERILKKQLALLEDKEKFLKQKENYARRLKEEIQFVKDHSLQEKAEQEEEIFQQASKYKGQLLDLKKELKQVKAGYGQKDRAHQKQIQILKDMVRDREEELTKLRDDLLLKELDLARKERELEAQKAISETKERLARVPSDVQRVKQQRVVDGELLKMKDRDIADLKERLAQALRQISALEKNSASVNQGEMNALKKQIEQIKKQLAERETYIDQKNNDFKLLKDRLADSQQRLDFVEQTIEEKDEQIGELEGMLKQLRDQCMK
ncbi:MAG: hypothetical protein WC552_04570 [Candidatus Omnitrophota bacterium]